MKKFAFVVTTIVLLLIPSVVNAKVVETKGSRTGDVVTIEKDEIINRDYFVAGDTINIYGTINGDLYVAGGQILFDGVVDGDLLVAGGMVDVNGTVTQDVRVVGGQVKVNGEVGRNLTAVGGDIAIAETAIITGSLVGAGGNLNLSAPINGNVMIGAGNLIVSNKIAGDLEAGVGTVTLTPNAQIVGDFNYWSEEDANISNSASISGITTKKDPTKDFDKEDVEEVKRGLAKFRKGATATGKTLGILSTLVVGLLLIHFFPKYSQGTIDTLAKKTWRSLGIGFAALFLTPFLFIALLFTVVGIPIAIILLVVYFIYLYLAKIFVMLWVGGFLANKISQEAKPSLAFILGLVVYTVLGLITGLGFFVRTFTLLFGLGAMLINCKKTYQLARKKDLI